MQVEYGNGRVEEFLPGEQLTPDTMRLPATLVATAVALVAFHLCMLSNLPPPAVVAQQQRQQRQQQQQQQLNAVASTSGAPAAGPSPPLQPRRPFIWERLRKWHAVAMEVCDAEDLEALGLTNLEPEVRTRVVAGCLPAPGYHQPCWAGAIITPVGPLARSCSGPLQLEVLEARMSQLFPPWVAFCHNDVQYGNMLLFRDGNGSSNRSDGAGETAPAAAGGTAPAAVAVSSSGVSSSGGGVTVRLIDFEYSSVNDVAYDIANHFCEWAYNYHSGESCCGGTDKPDQGPVMMSPA